MKKIFTTLISIITMATVSSFAQGRFETIALKHSTIHVYYTGDALGDASYVVEGPNALVTIETPIFKVNLSEFEAYVKSIGKPVVAEIADYHIGGTDDRSVIMAQGMGTFTKEGSYSAMMAGFQKGFGDSMVDLPTGEVTEIPFGDKVTLAGVEFVFSHGSATDFPAAAILIDGKALLTHWAPAKAHMNNLQLGSKAAVEAELDLLQAMKKSGAEHFLGGHGGAADKEALEFKTEYVRSVSAFLKSNSDPESFAEALKAKYPGLSGEEGLDALAQALYK